MNPFQVGQQSLLKGEQGVKVRPPSRGGVGRVPRQGQMESMKAALTVHLQVRWNEILRRAPIPKHNKIMMKRQFRVHTCKTAFPKYPTPLQGSSKRCQGCSVSCRSWRPGRQAFHTPSNTRIISRLLPSHSSHDSGRAQSREGAQPPPGIIRLFRSEGNYPGSASPAFQLNSLPTSR